MTQLLIKILVGFLIFGISAAAILFAAYFVTKYKGDITLKNYSSRLVALCVIATGYYTAMEIVDSVAFWFIELDDQGLLQLTRFIISLAFLVGFIKFLYDVWVHREEEAQGILKQIPILTLPIGLLIVGNIALMFI